jgi:methylmalonyl-CoA mutase C-terminal domain/subunit
VGLDGHDRGIKLVVSILREAGMEVVYLGKLQSPEGIVQTAIQEDVDIIGVSCLTGEHLTLVPDIVELVRKNNLRIPLVVGGIVPREDMPRLKDLGIAAVFTSGSTSAEIVKCIKDLAYLETR